MKRSSMLWWCCGGRDEAQARISDNIQDNLQSTRVLSPPAEFTADAARRLSSGRLDEPTIAELVGALGIYSVRDPRASRGISSLRRLLNRSQSEATRRDLAACVRASGRLPLVERSLRVSATRLDALILLSLLTSDMYHDGAAAVRTQLDVHGTFERVLPFIYLSPTALSGGRLLEGGVEWQRVLGTVYYACSLLSNLICVRSEHASILASAGRSRLHELTSAADWHSAAQQSSAQQSPEPSSEPQSSALPAWDVHPRWHPCPWAAPEVSRVARMCLANLRAAETGTSDFEFLDPDAPDQPRVDEVSTVNRLPPPERWSERGVARRTGHDGAAFSPRRQDDGIVALLSRLPVSEYREVYREMRTASGDALDSAEVAVELPVALELAPCEGSAPHVGEDADEKRLEVSPAQLLDGIASAASAWRITS